MKAQRLLGPQQEHVAVARFAQGLRGHGAHLLALEAGEAGRKAPQAGQAPGDGLLGEHAVGVEPGAQAHGLLQVGQAPVAGRAGAHRVELCELEAKAVGADVDRGQRPAVGPGQR
jgi:hypothetical protein